MVGGFTHIRRIAAAAAERGNRVITHGYKTNIEIAANLHFLASHRDAEVLEYSTSSSPLRWRTTRERIPIDDDGMVAVPAEPGLGRDPRLGVRRRPPLQLTRQQTRRAEPASAAAEPCNHGPAGGSQPRSGSRFVDRDPPSVNVGLQRFVIDLLVRVDLALLGDGDFVEVEGEPAEPVAVYDPASSQIDVGPFGRSSGGSGAEQDHLLQVRITSEHGGEIAQRCGGQFDFVHDSPTSCSANLLFGHGDSACRVPRCRLLVQLPQVGASRTNPARSRLAAQSGPALSDALRSACQGFRSP